MITHILKIEYSYLENLLSGKKKSEIRLNDRDYQVGDNIEFVLLNNPDDVYPLFEITHIHSGLGLDPGYVVLSVVKLIDKEE